MIHTTKPTRISGVRLDSEGETSVLVSQDEIFELNVVGAFMWSLCDGSHTHAEIVEEVVRAFDEADSDLVSEDVREFISFLRGAHLLLS